MCSNWRRVILIGRASCRHCRHEETISKALRSGDVDVETASDFLCLEAAKHCTEPLAPKEEPASPDEAVSEHAEGQQQLDAATAVSESAGSVKQEL